MTVHDLVHEIESDKSEIMNKGAHDRKNMLKLADAIICISENTKNDLMKFYPWLDEKKVRVIYHGFSENNIGKFCETREDYLFYVGKRSGYKNFSILIKAIKILKLSNLSIHVICAGGGDFSDDELSEINNAGLNEQFTQKYMTDSELANSYKNAKCFVFTSLYEGFGMPILEAFSFGCPVILSDCSCFPEIAGEAGVYFDPTNEYDLAQKIEKVILDKEYRNKMINEGYKRLSLFSWDDTAKKTVEVYTDVTFSNNMQSNEWLSQNDGGS